MENYKFFAHTECEYYPCHKIPEGSQFNCLFCYCPLHKFGAECGGNFDIIPNPSGGDFKDCSNCIYPHKAENYDAIITKLWK